MRTKVLAFLFALLPAAATLAAPSSEVRALHQEVAALQLDHALNVSAEQAKALLPILQNASTQLKALKAQRDASQPALVAALTQARDELRSTGAISESTRQAMKSARGGAAGAMRQDLQALHQQVNQILTPQQIQALKSVSLGVGHPSGNADMPARHGQRGFRKHFAIVKTLTSDAFLTLLQARAG